MFLINEEDGAVLDETRCGARVWGGGFGGQCEEKLSPSQMPRLCEFHLAQIKGRTRTLRYGYAFEDIPKAGMLEFKYYNANCLRDQAEVLFLTPARLKRSGISRSPRLKRQHANLASAQNNVVAQVRSPCAVIPERAGRAKKRCLVAPPLKSSQSRTATPANLLGINVPLAPEKKERKGKNVVVPKADGGVTRTAVMALKEVREAVDANTRAAVGPNDVKCQPLVKRVFMPPPRGARRSVWSFRGDPSPLEPRRLFESDGETNPVTAVEENKVRPLKMDGALRHSTVSTRAPSSASTQSSLRSTLERSLSSCNFADAVRCSAPSTTSGLSCAARLMTRQTSAGVCAKEAVHALPQKPLAAMSTENEAPAIRHSLTRKRAKNHLEFSQSVVKRAKLSHEIPSPSCLPTQASRFTVVNNCETTASYNDVNQCVALKNDIPALNSACRATSPEVFDKNAKPTSSKYIATSKTASRIIPPASPDNSPRRTSSKNIATSEPTSCRIALETPEHKPRTASPKNIPVLKPALRVISLETSDTESTSTSSKTKPASSLTSCNTSPEIIHNAPRAESSTRIPAPKPTSSTNVPAPKRTSRVSAPGKIFKASMATSSANVPAPKPASRNTSPEIANDASRATSSTNRQAPKPTSHATAPGILDYASRATSSANVPAPKSASRATAPTILHNASRATSSTNVPAPKSASRNISPDVPKENRSTTSLNERLLSLKPASRDASSEILGNKPSAKSSKNRPSSMPALRIIPPDVPTGNRSTTSSMKYARSSKPASRVTAQEMTDDKPRSASSKSVPSSKPALRVIPPDAPKQSRNTTSPKERIPLSKPASHIILPDAPISNQSPTSSKDCILFSKPASRIIPPDAPKNNRSSASLKERMPASKLPSCDISPQRCKPRTAAKETKPESGTRTNQRPGVANKSHTDIESELKSFFLNQPANRATTIKIASVFRLRGDDMKAACKRALKRLCEFNSGDQTYWLKPEFDPSKRTSATRRSVNASNPKKHTVSSASKEKTRLQNINTENEIRMFEQNLTAAKRDKKKIRQIIRSALIKYHPDKNSGCEETVRPIFMHVMDLKSKYEL